MILSVSSVEEWTYSSTIPNWRIMTIKEHRDIESKSEKSKKDEMPPLEDYNNVEYLVDKEAWWLVEHLMFKLKRMI